MLKLLHFYRKEVKQFLRVVILFVDFFEISYFPFWIKIDLNYSYWSLDLGVEFGISLFNFTIISTNLLNCSNIQRSSNAIISSNFNSSLILSRPSDMTSLRHFHIFCCWFFSSLIMKWKKSEKKKSQKVETEYRLSYHICQRWMPYMKLTHALHMHINTR